MALIGGSTWVSKLTRWDPTEKQSKVIQWALEARRAKIFLDRAAAGMYHEHDPNTRKQLSLPKLKEDTSLPAPNTTLHSKMFPNTKLENIKDSICIIDLGLDMSHFTKLNVIILPFVPKELNYNIESSYVAIKPIGRNNAGYHYTGSEDKLEFEIDWHSTNEGRDDVILNCRKIEALSKGNGYFEPPHYVAIQWSEQDLLFRNHTFVVISASYRLTQFSKGHMASTNNFKRTAMLPVQAYQKVVLARVTSNSLTSTGIIDL